MNSITRLLINDRIEQLQREAAQRRALPAQSSTIVRIADALRTIQAAITTPAPSRDSRFLPALIDYPTRG